MLSRKKLNETRKKYINNYINVSCLRNNLSFTTWRILVGLRMQLEQKHVELQMKS